MKPQRDTKGKRKGRALSFAPVWKRPLDRGKLEIIEVILETDKDADENCPKWTLLDMCYVAVRGKDEWNETQLASEIFVSAISREIQ